MSELLLGCGYRWDKIAKAPGKLAEWDDLVTLDINPDCKPDLQCDLNDPYWCCRPLTSRGERAVAKYIDDKTCVNNELHENYFSEVHAYEVLEHLGQQGDITSFFHAFDNIYRILIPNGLLFATCPSIRSNWLWGDPGHRRVIQKESLIFLDQSQYTLQIGKTPMSDYRNTWKSDFQILSSTDDGQFHRFVLQAIKPARISI